MIGPAATVHGYAICAVATSAYVQLLPQIGGSSLISSRGETFIYAQIFCTCCTALAEVYARARNQLVAIAYKIVLDEIFL